MIRRCVSLVVLAMLAVGCDLEPPSAREASTDDVATNAPAPTWAQRDGSDQVAVRAGDTELADAIAEARRTAEGARRRWDEASSHERSLWAVKWRAPTADGHHEFVWVEPLHWSLFRIEGRLASPPRRDLACGRGRDELVSFPSDELTDWIYRPPTGPDEGGFTVNVLERRYGGSAPTGP
ncbi:MAG: DUF2314 domain-containing protein [Planctomycetes bacterium]|nr:DUF2314 domain-containing protein [Planctomycetota bacterium]